MLYMHILSDLGDFMLVYGAAYQVSSIQGT
jgi:hypothetical protein